MFLYDANKTMKMLGNSCPLAIVGKGQVTEDDFKNLISAHRDAKAYPNYFEVSIDAFMLGFIYGKRAERARRKYEK